MFAKRIQKAEYAIYSKPLHSAPQYATAAAMANGISLSLEVEPVKQQQDNNPGRVWPRHK